MSIQRPHHKSHVVYLNKSEFERLSEIFHAAGIHVELIGRLPMLSDPNSEREQYRQETLRRAKMEAER